MRWILLDAALVLLALGLLALVGLRLWRQVTTLGQALERATGTLAEAAAQLQHAGSSADGLPADAAPPPRRSGSHRLSSGVRSGPLRRRPS